MKLEGCSAVVTGGASGLGAGSARALAKEGVKVAIFDMNAEWGEAIATEIGGVFCNVDISDEAQVKAGFAKARQAIGQERILINCAGIGGAAKTVSRDRKTGEIRPYPMDNYLRILNVNLIGTFRCIVESAAGMLTLDPMEDDERGAIVNTASVAAVEGQVGQVAYSASKGGIVGMTLPIARDLMDEGIRVNTILPGLFDTNIGGGMPAEMKAAVGATLPFPKRLGTAAEFASLALEMCRNSYFNGEHVRLDAANRLGARWYVPTPKAST